MYTWKTPAFALRATITCLAICVGTPATAAVLAHFDFDGAAGAFENGPETTAPGLGIGGFYAEIGTVSDFTGTEGRALAARNFAAGNALVLDITIPTGLTVDLSGVSFDHLASASGPTQWSLRVAGQELLQGSTPTTFDHVDATFALTGISGLLRVALHGSGAASNGGTYRLDNFMLHGAVSAVPLAPALLLFGSATALLPLARRR